MNVVEDLKKKIAKTASDPNVVAIITRAETCPPCIASKELIKSKQLSLEEIVVDGKNASLVGEVLRYIKSAFRNQPDNLTFPRCFMDGKLVGGSDDLRRVLATRGPSAPSAPSSSSSSSAPSSSSSTNASSGSDGGSDLPGWLTAPPAARPVGTPSSLEEGLFAMPTRKLNFEPMISSIGKTLDPMYSDLKRCMCEGFAELFVKSAPVVIDTVMKSMVETAINDEQTHAYLNDKIKDMILSIKSSGDKDRILRNLDGECRQVFVQVRQQESKSKTMGGGNERQNKGNYRFTRKLYHHTH